MRRIHDARRFRAASAWLDWLGQARHRFQVGGGGDGRDHAEELARLKEHGDRIRLVWSVHPELGVPRAPFTVWQRVVAGKPERWDVTAFPHRDGQWILWGGTEVVSLELDVQVGDPGRPVGLYLLRTFADDPAAAVGSTITTLQGRGSIRASAPFASLALLVNAEVVGASAVPLQQVIEADDWKPLEIVGHPVEPGELGSYDGTDQGLLTALGPAPQAGIERLERAGPPLGWWWATETGRAAPTWSAPDPGGLVKELRTRLYPEVAKVFDVAENDQVRLVDQRLLDGPQQAGRTSTDRADARIPLLRTLLVAAGGDPFTAIATGFATGYRPRDLVQHPYETELLVTAPYSVTPGGERDVELAAYLPPCRRHGLVPPVVDLRAARAVLSVPAGRDAPFHESIEVSWLPRQGPAVLSGPVSTAFVGLDTIGSPAVDLLPERENGGSQPRLIAAPKADPLRPGSDRPRLVDADRELPDEGSVTRGYAVAQVNLFGVWSPWQDAACTTAAPTLRGPRLVATQARARWTGSASCPAEVDVEVAAGWKERTPGVVEVLALAYPMATGTTPPPAVDLSVVAPPAGTRTATITFAGDEPVTVTPGTVVVGLDTDGVELTRTPLPDGVAPPAVPPPPRPGGTATQGEDGRRYRVTIPLPDLDFSGVSRWGVRVWARLRVTGYAQPSAYSPRPQDPATSVVASPVPHVPEPLPLPPDVPLASTPDHRGRSHVRVAWRAPVPAQVDRLVVWETSETVVRERLGMPAPSADTIPGARLAALWAAYDATPADRRKVLFRRAQEVVFRPHADPGEVDVELPRGSRDIHLFVVTTATTTGLESPWPEGSGALPAHAHLQAAIAPRLLQPSLPLVRPAIGADGVARVDLAASSPVPVTVFEVFATRSPRAALDHLTMGPPVASVAAVDSGQLDAVTRRPVYTASWSATPALPPSWDDWHLRAVAVPPRVVGPRAERGVVSPSSEVVTLRLRPSAPPDLDPLVAEVLGEEGRLVVVRSATRAPERASAEGPHLLSVTVDGSSVADGGGGGGDLRFAVPLGDLVEHAGEAPPAPPPDLPLVTRRARVSGATGLRVWLRRPDAATPVTVTALVRDPAGRTAQREVVVPPWVPPQPSLTIDLVDVFRLAGRGLVATLVTSATTAEPGVTLRVVATRRRRFAPTPLPGPRPVPLPGAVPGPRQPVPVPGRRDGLEVLAGNALEASFVLAEVPSRIARTPGTIAAQLVPSNGGDAGTRVVLWIGMDATRVVVEIADPAGGTVGDEWRA